MRRFLMAFSAVCLLSACEEMTTGTLPATVSSAPTPNEVAAAGIPPRQDATTYLCANGQVVQARYLDADDVMALGQEAVVLYIDGRSIRMLRGASASGVRYIGGGLQWWTRGLLTANLAPLGPNESLASAPGTECRSAG